MNTSASRVWHSPPFHVVLPGFFLELPTVVPSLLFACLSMGDLHGGVFVNAFIMEWNAIFVAGFLFVVPPTCALPPCVGAVYFLRALILLHIFGPVSFVCSFFLQPACIALSVPFLGLCSSQRAP